MPTVTSEIDRIVKNLADCHQQIKVLKDVRDHSLEERKSISEEIKAIRNVMEESEKELAHLRKENRRTMLVSVAIFGLCACIYVIYSTLQG